MYSTGGAPGIHSTHEGYTGKEWVTEIRRLFG